MTCTIYHWQDQPEVLAMYDRRSSFGAWAVVLHAEMLIATKDDIDESTFDRIRSTHIDPRIDEHGDVPRDFARCWLIDEAKTYGWLSRRETDAETKAWQSARLQAARHIWRRRVGGQA